MMQTSARDLLAEHPRLIGALFGLVALLATSGAAAACRRGFIVGP